MFLEISLGVRLPLVCFNLLILYASYKKTRKSIADFLTASWCVFGIAHYCISFMAFVILRLLLHESAPHVLRNLVMLVDYFFYLVYCQTIALFFIDRYIATVHPISYKVKMRTKYAHVGLTMAASLAAILLLLTVAFTYSSVLCYDKKSLDRIVLTFFILSCVIIFFSYAYTCRALLHFFGRQMCIFRKTIYCNRQPVRLRRESIKQSNVSALSEPFIIEEEETDLEACTRKLSPQSATSTKMPSSKLSLPLLDYPLSSREKLKLREARFSCPVLACGEFELQSSVEIPLWMLSSLAEKLHQDNRDKEEEEIERPVGRARAGTFPAARVSMMEKTTPQKMDVTPRDHAYSLVNLLSDLKLLRNNRDSVDFSQTKHLIRNLTIKTILHVFSCIPFVIAALLLETRRGSVTMDERIVAFALHGAVCCHLCLPVVYALGCHPYRSIMRNKFKRVGSAMKMGN